MKIIPSSRRNRYIAGVGIVLVAVTLIVGMISCGGTPSSVEIRDWYDLDAIRDNLSGNYTLMNDLDSTTAGYEELASPTANNGTGWQPIGTQVEGFTGTFDGQGYEISDLFINRPDKICVGLFGHVGEGGVIKNLGVVNVAVIGYRRVGSMLGYNEEGTVTNSCSSGSVTGSTSVGGLVGGNEGIVSNSYSTGNVTGDSFVGGLVEGNDGVVNNSFWDIETSGQSTSEEGTGKTTAEMQSITTFGDWNIIEVANLGERNPAYTWNIVNGETYPFLSWQSV